jgi:hypothetical protein
MEHWHIIQHFNSVGSIRLLSGVFTFHRHQGMDTSRSDRACILDDGRPGLRSCLIPKWLLPYPSGLTSAFGLLVTCIPCASSVMTDSLLKATFTNLDTPQLFQHINLRFDSPFQVNLFKTSFLW